MKRANCIHCGRTLKNLKSVERGIGPVCARNKRVDQDQQEWLEDIYTPYTGGDIVLERLPSGQKKVNVEHRIKKHSPTGFEWRYGGSGPADLALNILLNFVSEEMAYWLHQEFKSQVIASIPEKGGVIKREDIETFIANNSYEGARR